MNNQQNTIDKNQKKSKSEQYVAALKSSNSSVVAIIATMFFTIETAVVTMNSFFSMFGNIEKSFLDRFYSLIEVLPNVLMCIGLWLNFVFSMSKYVFKPTGLKFVTTGIKIRLLYNLLFVVYYVITMFNNPSLSFILYILGLLYMIFSFLYDSLVLSAAKTMLETLNYGCEIENGHFTALAVCNIIFAVVNLCNLSDGDTTTITNLLSSIAMLLFAINLLRLKKRMQGISEAK
jgi:hypothetical protein